MYHIIFSHVVVPCVRKRLFTAFKAVFKIKSRLYFNLPLTVTFLGKCVSLTHIVLKPYRMYTLNSLIQHLVTYVKACLRDGLFTEIDPVYNCLYRLGA